VLLEDGTTVFPLFPLLRAVVEHGAWVCWLLDPGVGLKARAVRGALAELRSDQEMVGVVKRWVGANRPEFKTVRAKLEQTRDAIRRDFGNLDTERMKIGGEGLPRPTEVIEHFGQCDGNAREWQAIYNYPCGTATHPSQNPFEFVHVGATGTPELALTESFVERMVRVGLAVYMHSLVHAADYLGWSRAPMRKYQARIDSTLTPIQLSS